MRYLVLIYGNPENWEHPVFLQDPRFLGLPPDEREEVARRAEELRREITASGELVEGTALGPPEATRTVRAGDGVPVVTDGPYLEAKEHLAGYVVIDVAGPERAASIASRIAESRVGAVEIRLIMS